MKALVLYDSIYGNTKRIADVISSALGKDVKVVSVTDTNPKTLERIDLIVVGSPIIAWKPSEKMGIFLAGLSAGQLKGLQAATFDTRVKMFIHGDASKKISQALETAGAKIIVESQVFYVKGRQGPLFEGEVEKAAEWATAIKNAFMTK